MDSDRIVVLEAGRVAEQGRPADMLENPEGYLSRMVAATGEKQAQFLLREGCTFLQGFLTCMPTTVEGMLDVLSKGQPS